MREVSTVHEKGALTHPAQVLELHPLYAADARKNTAVSLATGGKAVGKGGYLLHRGLTSDALSYKESTKPCNLEDWMVLSVKQALVGAGCTERREGKPQGMADHTTGNINKRYSHCTSTASLL